MLPFAALGCLSNFSFLRGASHADELVQQAKWLGWPALGLCDIAVVEKLGGRPPENSGV